MITPAQKLILFLTMLLGSLPALAQWTTQTIDLRPGWNAVFLEVQPEPKDCDAIFADLPVESVWAWNRRFSSAQFIQDPDQLIVAQPDWLTYVPATRPARSSMNLFVLEGGRPYLIKLAATTGAIAWKIQGRAVVCSRDWLSDSMNFVGFPVDETSPPTFQSFFASSPAHAAKPIFRLNALGQWDRVSAPNSTTMKSGEAFWVRCEGPSAWSGPMSATLERRSGLDYGQVLIEQTVLIKNHSTSARTFTVRPLPSAKPPHAGVPALAGDVPLSYFRRNLAGNDAAWVPLTTPLSQANLGPGEEWMLRLAVRRIDMDSVSPLPSASAPLYQGLLEISDGAGSRSLLPVTAQGLQSFAAASSGLVQAMSIHPYAGLWVGSASINKVSQTDTNQAQPNLPVPTGSEFQFRLIVHVNNLGQPRLLQKVLQVWIDGTYTNDNFGIRYVDRPGSYRLYTDENSVTTNAPWARRISSAAFGFTNAIPMSAIGSFGSSNFTNSCSVPIHYDDPLNPFKHRYHPDHNNLDERYEVVLGDKTESFTVTRNLRLVFTPNDPLNLALAGWGDDQLGGFYSENISGLNRTALYVSGTFRLHRVTNTGALN